MNIHTYVLAEVANVHGGNPQYVEELIDAVKAAGADGIKFQPFRYDYIATADYEYYATYEALYMVPETWQRLIQRARNAGLDVWIDTFDVYSCDVIRASHGQIRGIKLQASILHNAEVRESLASMDLSGKLLMLNISGFSTAEASSTIEEIAAALQPERVVRQVGYQAYPTPVEDSGLSKLRVLRADDSHAISFADHADAASPDAFTVPICAMSLGAEIIEKHVRLRDREARYDFQSSIDEAQFSVFVEQVRKYDAALSSPFVSDAERLYLAGTRQIPIATRALRRGSTISLEDLSFKRSGRTGLTVPELLDRRDRLHVLGNDVEAGTTIRNEDLKPATVAAVIACRLKSSRLPRKALSQIGSLRSVELCIKNTLRLQNVHHVVLATSTVAEDAELCDATYSPRVIFHRGDPDDVIDRYLGILGALRAEILVRITADMPYVSAELVELLLRSHFETGADFSRVTRAAVGTAAEIITVDALRRVKKHFPRADYSEYMYCYFTNNRSHFRVNDVEPPDELVRDYRLTLDHQEDLQLLNAVQKHLEEEGLEPSLHNIFAYLDARPEVRQVNAHIALKYTTDPDLIRTLEENTIIR